MIVEAYDFETTGVDPKKCEPLQFAKVRAEIAEDGGFTILEKFETIIQIEAEVVPPGAQNVHGISKEKTVAEGVPPSIIAENLGGVVLGFNNWRYDDVIAKRFGAEIGQSLDVFKLAQKAKRQGMISKASLSATYASVTGKTPENAHDALADVIMTLEVLRPLMQLLEIPTLMDAIHIMNNEVNHMTMPFGKHKGMPVKDLPLGYVSWLRKNVPLSGDLEQALNQLG